MKTIFIGTADLARVTLEALASASGIELVGVVTQPDRPQGRNLQLLPSPVKKAALNLHLPIFQPLKARDPAFHQIIAGLSPELIIVAAYGQILPQAILDLPKFGCLNVHASLLPKYRGAAPIQWAILDDEPVTGVTIMKMDAGLDTGAILTQQSTRIEAEDNGKTLHDRLAILGARLLLETIPGYVGGRISPLPQPVEGASYARKIVKADGQIQWHHTARRIWNQIRAFNPWPGSFSKLGREPATRLLKIWRASENKLESGRPGLVLRAGREDIVVACGQNALNIEELQLEGGKRLSSREFLAGHVIPEGTQLS